MKTRHKKINHKHIAILDIRLFPRGRNRSYLFFAFSAPWQVGWLNVATGTVQKKIYGFKPTDL